MREGRVDESKWNPPPHPCSAHQSGSDRIQLGGQLMRHQLTIGSAESCEKDLDAAHRSHLVHARPSRRQEARTTGCFATWTGMRISCDAMLVDSLPAAPPSATTIIASGLKRSIWAEAGDVSV